ncbi:hypothetical protein TorRG33x02_143810 [Trema orientale]|uniref:Uncharacterized protein n=1 Tax=Trema orientale TaxID=63057 RepID=A0A2P5EWD9_TREOI|nr:hypothetical protein TorRG33x02_143810 [Trema orientale]
MEELKTFQRYNDNLIPEATHLLTLDNFRCVLIGIPSQFVYYNICYNILLRLCRYFFYLYFF